MEVRAQARFVRVTPFKARRVVDLIRGLHVEEARRVLRFTPRAAALPVRKVLDSAIANAEHNHQVRSFDDLRVGAFIDGGPVMKRIQPRAMGRAFHIRHRTSHITITLSEPADGQPGRPPSGKAPGRGPGGGKPAAAKPTGGSPAKRAATRSGS